MPTATTRTRPADPPPTDGHDRDPAVDLLRAAALAIVVAGHWLLAVVVWRGDTLDARNLLDAAPATQWATWLFQPMPLFFAVAGWAAARSRTRGATPRSRTDRVATRLQRLLVPTATYVAVATIVVLVLTTAVGRQADPVAKLLGLHLWFLAVFVPVTAATPWLCDLVATRGWRVPAVVGGAVVATDLVRFVIGVPGVGWANFAFVWIGFTTVGIAAAFRPPCRGALVATVGLSATALVGMVAAGWYPHSMVGVGDRSNNTPPTVALGLLGLAQVACAALARPALRRSIQSHRRLARGIGVAGAVGMHTYLWHLCAVVVAVGVMRLGPGNLEPLRMSWWATRPLWWVALGAVTLPIVAAATRHDRRRLERAGTAPMPPSTQRVALVTIVAATALTVIALFGIASGPVTVVAASSVIVAGRVGLGRAGHDGTVSGIARGSVPAGNR